MAYDQTVPATGHSGSQDYNAIRGNFAQLQSTFSIDHEPIASGGGIDGFHKQAHLVSLGTTAGDPPKVTSAGIIYTRTPGTHTELFYEGEITTGKILQITDQSLTTASGEGFMPGGLQVRGGFNAVTVGSTKSISWTQFPVATVSVLACAVGNNNIFSVDLASVTTSGATIRINGSAVAQFYWIAIGY